MSETSKRAVKAIVRDLSERRGLSHQWDMINSLVKAEIVATWESIIDTETASPPWIPGPPTEPGEWWATIEDDGERRVVDLSVRRCDGILWWLSAGELIAPLDADDEASTIAHMPLSRPEPYRGEP